MPFDPMNYTPPVVDADGEVLLRAADLIDRHGWTQNPCIWLAFQGRPTPLCIGLALQQALRNEPGWESIRKRLGGISYPAWNDEPGRTKEEVTGLLRTAALSAASGRAPTNKEE